MERDPAPVLADIRRGIERLRALREPDGSAPALPEFSDRRVIAERWIEIISEASRRLPSEWKAEFPGVPWREIAGIGNHIRHGYDRIDEGIVREVIEDHVEELDRAIRAMESRKG